MSEVWVDDPLFPGTQIVKYGVPPMSEARRVQYLIERDKQALHIEAPNV